jgi:hypothetical protein
MEEFEKWWTAGEGQLLHGICSKSNTYGIWQVAAKAEREACAVIAENSHPNYWPFIASKIRGAK